MGVEVIRNRFKKKKVILQVVQKPSFLVIWFGEWDKLRVKWDPAATHTSKGMFLTVVTAHSVASLCGCRSSLEFLNACGPVYLISHSEKLLLHDL